jgi:hypothetical protein
VKDGKSIAEELADILGVEVWGATSGIWFHKEHLFDITRFDFYAEKGRQRDRERPGRMIPFRP